MTIKKLIFAALLSCCSLTSKAFAVGWGLEVDTNTISLQRFGTFAMTGSLTSSTTSLVTELQYAEAMGAGIIRFNMDNWTQLEPSSGVFDWSYLDRVVAITTGTGVNQFGMEMLITIPGAPAWQCDRFVSTTTLNPYTGAVGPAWHYPTSDMGLVRRFCLNLATRYSGSIRYYEIANESDNKNYWIDTASTTLLTSPTNYYMFLATAATAIRDGDTTSEILNAGIAFPRGITQQVLGATITYTNGHYFAHLLALGATQYIDIVNTHHYYDSELGDLTTDIVVSTMTDMWRNVTGEKPRIWVTEFGKFGGDYTTGDVDEEEYQKANLLLWNYAHHFSSGTERMFWQTLRAPGIIDSGDYAMLDNDFTHRPVYDAHTTFYEYLNGYTFSGTQNNGDVIGTEWTNGSSTRYVFGAAPGDSGTISFTPQPHHGIKVDANSEVSTVYGDELLSYPVTDDFFILEVFDANIRVMNLQLNNLTIQ